MGIMMNKGQVFLFGILLSAVVLTESSRGIKEPRPLKPGTCPPQRHKPAIFPFRCVSTCKNDDTCTGDKKCCFDNCQKICKPPAQERPGECPIETRSNATDCYDFCTDDNECSGGGKCCPSSCGRSCTSTVQVKKGFCQQEQLLKCSVMEADYCGSDKNCYRGEKCCPKLCRKECQPALKERAGTCPVSPPTCSNDAKKVCQTDYDCAMFYKCCQTNCGFQCLKAVNVPSFLVYGTAIPVFNLQPGPSRT
ncbi:hypothetical protein XENTR_v10003851 [Xenopus tropicalis]|uniref:WAP four-disulfide core domain protein 3-like n=1 Tax=Xenopus tropicalis TaxID=8364 RepID=A0A803J685_XENTR|nr:WAP four-disulfide core domain protein 3-like [Xenopus tropicalis]KAE8575489.1 hypothetical protein XENTR_v10003851 [Xenopus tropicalis]